MDNVYRAYFLNHDGKIGHAPVVLECDSDEHAIELAAPMLDGHDIEIWHGKRVVATLHHDDLGRRSSK